MSAPRRKAILPDPITLSPTQAARRLGIGRSAFYELMNRRKIEARKLGSRTIITVAEVDRFLASLPLRRVKR